MGRKRHTAEEIVKKLREADVLLAKGQTVGLASEPQAGGADLET